MQSTYDSRPLKSDETATGAEAKHWRQFKIFLLLPVSVGTIVSYGVLSIVSAIHYLAPWTDALMANSQKIALIASVGSAIAVGFIGAGMVAKGLSMPAEGSKKKR